MVGIHCCQYVTLLRELMEYIYQKVESFNSYVMKFNMMPVFSYITEWKPHR